LLDGFLQLLQAKKLIAPLNPVIDLGQVFGDLIQGDKPPKLDVATCELIEDYSLLETMLIERLDPKQVKQTLLPLAQKGQVYAEVKPPLVDKFIGILSQLEALKGMQYTLELMGPPIAQAGSVVEREVLLKHEDTITF
jgi:hypothetical protein